MEDNPRCFHKPILAKSWHGLAHHRRLAPPLWPKRLVLPCEGVSWELPKTPNVEKEKKKVGVGSVAPHHLAKASPLWIWRSFREDVLSPFGMVAKAVRLHSVHELLRVVLSAQNTRGGAEYRLFLNTTSRRTRPRSLFTRKTESLLSEFYYLKRDAAPAHHVFWANKTTLKSSCTDCNVTAVATMPLPIFWP